MPLKKLFFSVCVWLLVFSFSFRVEQKSVPEGIRKVLEEFPEVNPEGQF